MDAKALAELLFETLHRERGVQRVQHYEDVGLLSSGNGIVVTMDSGAQFNVTITQVRHAPVSRDAGSPQGCRWPRFGEQW